MNTPYNDLPAFPTSITAESSGKVWTAGECVIGGEGMTLRDWFAGRIIPSILSIATETVLRGGAEQSVTSMVRDAYNIADAMIAQREVR